MEKSDFETHLVKLRDACLFYVKGDVLALGASLTLASVLKLEKTDLIQIAISNRWLLVAIGFLIAMGLAIECAITCTVATTDVEQNAKKAKQLRLSYRIYIVLQLFGLGFLLGHISKYLDLLANGT